MQTASLRSFFVTSTPTGRSNLFVISTTRLGKSVVFALIALTAAHVAE
jgi:hypothetical protein